MVAPTISMTYEGKPMSVLNDLIEKRQKYLGETVRDSVIATAILCVKSLRADTRNGKKQAKNSDVEVTDTGWVGGWMREGAKKWRCARYSAAPGAHRVRGVRPVNLAGQQYVKGEKVKVYKVVPVHHRDDWRWAKNTNAKDRCWYVLAKSEKVARDFGKRQVSRYMQRWRGLAKTALGFAMAKLSTRGVKSDPVSAKAMKAAELNAKVFKGGGNGQWSIVVTDSLNYAKKALKSGPGGVDRAMKKAANQIAGRIWAVAGHKLDSRPPTPFPEVKGKR
jgi:hypothetical protein